ncbi:MAG: transcriptional regulator [Thermoflexus sp.]|uniref:LCP family protein n=1 Tax=Thermoflexus sp. TaxID=1969742 RepID=UPI003327ADA4
MAPTASPPARPASSGRYYRLFAVILLASTMLSVWLGIAVVMAARAQRWRAMAGMGAPGSGPLGLPPLPEVGRMLNPIEWLSPAPVWPVPGRLNVLILGVDRRPEEREVPVRSDAIMLIGLDPISQTISVLSIPRDLYVPIPGLEERGISQSRINTACFYGDYYHLGGCGELAKQTVAYNFGLPVHRYVILDFNGFKRIIDLVGGIEVEVPRTIVDNAYPTDDYRTERLVIPAGRIHMDGDLALKYVRTRHADSDFGRLKRQQQVLMALRAKVLSLRGLPQIPEILRTLGDSVQTDLSVPEMLAIAQFARGVLEDRIRLLAVEPSMVRPWQTPGGAAVLIPDRRALADVVKAFQWER